MSENSAEFSEVVEWTFLMTNAQVGPKVMRSWFLKSDVTSFEIYELHWSYALEFHIQNCPRRTGVRERVHCGYQYI
jgi:hypothetical protein